jgi:flagellar hook-basal body complex protein FliE
MSATVPVSLFGAPLGVSSPEGSFAALPNNNLTARLALGGVGATDSGLSPSSPSAPFADLLTEAVGQVGQLESQAKSAVEGLMAGTGVDVHQAMIATEKAEMGFELVLSVRNKALAAYQQVMGMQF